MFFNEKLENSHSGPKPPFYQVPKIEKDLEVEDLYITELAIFLLKKCYWNSPL